MYNADSNSVTKDSSMTVQSQFLVLLQERYTGSYPCMEYIHIPMTKVTTRSVWF